MTQLTLKEMQSELSKLMAQHIADLKAETFIPMSKDQTRKHEQRLELIRKLSEEYLAFLRVDR